MNKQFPNSPTVTLTDNQLPLVSGMHGSTAVFSDCKRYRYELWRRWGPGTICVFICLNPSTADEFENDPTVRRCIHFAKQWGHEAFCMLNLFAFRATQPAVMKASEDPVGRWNDTTIRTVARKASIIVAGWGTDGRFRDREQSVLKMVREIHPVHCLKLNTDGTPAHPLYLKKSLQPVELT